jgi:hypothetical protein
MRDHEYRKPNSGGGQVRPLRIIDRILLLSFTNFLEERNRSFYAPTNYGGTQNQQAHFFGIQRHNGVSEKNS